MKSKRRGSRTWLRRPATLVSLIIPVKNEEANLEAFFDCLDRQSSENFETIFVDDGSIDETPKLVSRYSSARYRVTAAQMPATSPIGCSAARKEGFQLSRGEFIVFLDADDLINPALIESLEVKIMNENPDAIIWDYSVFNNEDRSVSQSFQTKLWPSSKECYSAYDLRENLFQLTNPALWNKALRRPLVKQTLPALSTQLTWANDLPLTYAALALTEKIAFLNQCMITHVRSPNRLSEKRFSEPAGILQSLILLSRIMAETNVDSTFAGTFKELCLRQLEYHSDVIGEMKSESLHYLLPNFFKSAKVQFSKDEQAKIISLFRPKN